MEDKALLDSIRAIVKEEIQSETQHLKADVARLDHDIGPKLDLILEMLKDSAGTPREIKILKDTAEDHETRIWALEKVVKAL